MLKFCRPATSSPYKEVLSEKKKDNSGKKKKNKSVPTNQ